MLPRDPRSSPSRSSGTSDLATAAPVVHDVFGDERTQSQTFIQFAHQKQTTVGGDARTLEINFQRRVKRELKGLFLFLTHWVEASTMLIVLPKPHECWRWRDHTTTYSEFKKEMWAHTRSRR